MERTCALIKPDAVKAGYSADIIACIEDAGFKIARLEKRHLTQEEAQEFYAVHKERPFFGELVEFMTSGPIVAIALEKEDAVSAWRNLMGATDPAQAEPGTIRARFGSNVGENATHGSDSHDNAETELAFFFPDLD